MVGTKKVQQAQVKRYHNRSRAVAWQEYQLTQKRKRTARNKG